MQCIKQDFANFCTCVNVWQIFENSAIGAAGVFCRLCRSPNFVVYRRCVHASSIYWKRDYFNSHNFSIIIIMKSAMLFLMLSLCFYFQQFSSLEGSSNTNFSSNSKSITSNSALKRVLQKNLSQCIYILYISFWWLFSEILFRSRCHIDTLKGCSFWDWWRIKINKWKPCLFYDWTQ